MRVKMADQQLTQCDRCGCSYSAELRPPGSLCEDQTAAMDRWFDRAEAAGLPDHVLPTDDDLRADQCVGICRVVTV